MDESLFVMVKAVFSPGIQKIILGMLLFIIISAHFIWYFERGKDAISDSYFPGIFEGAWWTIVTMSTVGYGDIAPKKWSGRLTAVLVIVTGIAFFGIVIAELSSSFAIKKVRSSIESIEDLRGRAVATVEGTTSNLALKERDQQLVLTRNFDESYKMLKDGKVEAVVFDTPVLKHFLKRREGKEFQIVGQFEPQYYGIALQADSPWREIINRGILDVQESGRFEKIYRKWFDSEG